MINKILASLIIESKQGTYDALYNLIKGYAVSFRELQNEPGNDDDDRVILKEKEDLMWSLLDDLHNEFESHIEEVKNRYECLESSGISAGYLQHLPNGWTQSA